MCWQDLSKKRWMYYSHTPPMIMSSSVAPASSTACSPPPVSTPPSSSSLFFPNWIHVYYPTNTSTSRRTQAAAIAYLFFDEFGLSADTSQIFPNRFDRISSSLREIIIPMGVLSRLPSLADVRDAIYVCDGGVNYSLPAAHPHSVSYAVYIVFSHIPFLTF